MRSTNELLQKELKYLEKVFHVNVSTAAIVNETNTKERKKEDLLLVLHQG